MAPPKKNKKAAAKPKPKPSPKRKRRKNAAVAPPPAGVDPYRALAEKVEPRTEESKRKKGRKSKDEGLELLRHLAEIKYTTDPKGISLKGMASTEPFCEVSHKTLSQWCAADDWVDKRQEYFDGIRDGIKKKLGKRLIKISVDQLKNLDSISKTVYRNIKSSEPKSMEGMVAAYTNVVKTSNELRDRIAQEIVPGQLGGPAEAGSQITPKLNEEEARAAALAIMHVRRVKIRAESDEGDDAKSDEKPTLRVVSGGVDEQG